VQTRRSHPPRMQQRGIALIVGLVILVVLALIGASAYSVATQDERIAGNARDHARALEAAETMLRDCENHVQYGTTTTSWTTTGTDPGMYYASTTPGMTWLSDQTSWASLNPRNLASYTTIDSQWQGGQPQCIAELYPPSATQPIRPAGWPVGNTSTPKVAHIAARGYGLNPNTSVTLVSYLSWW